jgi:MFS family permease
MFFAVLFLFKEPRRTDEVATTSLGQAAKNFLTVVSNPRFMLFLIIFSGYYIVFWQQFIILPIYIHDYINPHANTERILATDSLVVIALQLVVTLAIQKMSSLKAITLGTLISGLAWIILALQPSVLMAVVAIAFVAIGEITQQPRYYEYISRLAPPGQQGTYMGFAFLPIGIGSLVAGWLGGKLMRHFGEVMHQPALVWWAVAGIGVLTAGLLWLYDRFLKVEAMPQP